MSTSRKQAVQKTENKLRVGSLGEGGYLNKQEGGYINKQQQLHLRSVQTDAK